VFLLPEQQPFAFSVAIPGELPLAGSEWVGAVRYEDHKSKKSGAEIDQAGSWKLRTNAASAEAAAENN
jgi:hypothetical protein